MIQFVKGSSFSRKICSTKSALPDILAPHLGKGLLCRQKNRLREWISGTKMNFLDDVFNK
jgi:hypothetical protein